MSTVPLEKTQELTRSNPKTALVNLRLNAVALCGEGANSRADIILTKRKETMNMPKSFAELLEALQPAEADLIKNHLAAEVAAAEAAKDAEIGELTKSVTSLQGQVATLEKSKPAEDAILKGLSPEAKALFAKQQEAIDTLVKARQEETANVLFAKVKAIPCEESVLKSVLSAASPAVVEVLEKAAAAIEKGAMEATGRDGQAEFTGTRQDDYYAKLEKSAKEIAVAKGCTFEQAFYDACAADPDTYRKYAEGGK